MYANKFVFRHPTRCLVVGPSCSGKTSFIRRVILHKEKLFSTVPQRIIYTYVYPQDWFSSFQDVEFTKEIPNDLDPSIPSVIVLDDIICDAKSLKQGAHLFVRGSHHLNASVFCLSQNLFTNNGDFRTISLNATQYVLFKTRRGLRQIELLARQLFDRCHIENVIRAYKESTREPFSYLMIDVDVMQEFPLRACIFPDDKEEIVYVLQ